MKKPILSEGIKLTKNQRDLRLQILMIGFWFKEICVILLAATRTKRRHYIQKFQLMLDDSYNLL